MSLFYTLAFSYLTYTKCLLLLILAPYYCHIKGLYNDHLLILVISKLREWTICCSSSYQSLGADHLLFIIVISKLICCPVLSSTFFLSNMCCSLSYHNLCVLTIYRSVSHKFLCCQTNCCSLCHSIEGFSSYHLLAVLITALSFTANYLPNQSLWTDSCSSRIWCDWAAGFLKRKRTLKFSLSIVAAQVQWNLAWETTTIREHLSCKARYSW